MKRRRVVITAPDITAKGYSGMGLRALGIAEELGEKHDVQLLVAGIPRDPPAHATIMLTSQDHDAALGGADVVITSNALRFRQLFKLKAALVSDLYDPSYFEWLSLDDSRRIHRRTWVHRQVRALQQAVAVSDTLMCANDRQRDLYLGMHLASASARYLAHESESSFDEKLIVVPNGIPSLAEGALSTNRELARGRLGLDRTDVVLLWGGGIWDWTDPFTVLEAVIEAHRTDQRIRLVFLGVQRSSSPDPHQRHATALLERCHALGIVGSVVRLNESWISPHERIDYVAAADAGILGQYENLETHFSFRTRFIDCLWANIPVLSMSGDSLSDEAAAEGWGLVSPPGSVPAMRDNILRFARDEDLRDSMREQVTIVRKRYSWRQCCEPLGAAIDSLERPTPSIRVLKQRALVTERARGMCDRLSWKLSRDE